MKTTLMLLFALCVTVMSTHFDENNHDQHFILRDEVLESQMGDWKRVKGKDPDPNANIELIIVVVENQAIINQAMSEINNKDSVNYGKKLSKKDLSEIAMMPGDRAACLNWIRTLPNQRHVHLKGKEDGTGAHLVVLAPISTWEVALNTKFHFYEDGDERIIRTEAYSLPEAVSSNIASVLGTVQFPAVSTIVSNLLVNPGLANLAAGGSRTDVNERQSSSKL